MTPAQQGHVLPSSSQMLNSMVPCEGFFIHPANDLQPCFLHRPQTLPSPAWPLHTGRARSRSSMVGWRRKEEEGRGGKCRGREEKEKGQEQRGGVKGSGEGWLPPPPGCSGNPLQLLPLPLSGPEPALRGSQPWVGARGVRWRGQRGWALTTMGQAHPHPPHTPQGNNSSPCERFQACSPLRKPYMPKPTHTKQAHQGGACTIKGFFALRGEGSAHGKLKIGASPVPRKQL